MEEFSDAGSIPASSTIRHEEGPARGGRNPDDLRQRTKRKWNVSLE